MSPVLLLLHDTQSQLATVTNVYLNSNLTWVTSEANNCAAIQLQVPGITGCCCFLRTKYTDIGIPCFAETNPCEPDPCLNGGACDPNGGTCNCTGTGFMGTTCQGRCIFLHWISQPMIRLSYRSYEIKTTRWPSTPFLLLYYLKNTDFFLCVSDSVAYTSIW